MHIENGLAQRIRKRGSMSGAMYSAGRTLQRQVRMAVITSALDAGEISVGVQHRRFAYRLTLECCVKHTLVNDMLSADSSAHYMLQRRERPDVRAKRFLNYMVPPQQDLNQDANTQELQSEILLASSLRAKRVRPRSRVRGPWRTSGRSKDHLRTHNDETPQNADLVGHHAQVVPPPVVQRLTHIKTPRSGNCRQDSGSSKEFTGISKFSKFLSKQLQRDNITIVCCRSRSLSRCLEDIRHRSIFLEQSLRLLGWNKLSF